MPGFLKFLFSALILAISCDRYIGPDQQELPDYSGMCEISGAGASFRQGCDDPSASFYEKPVTPSSFTYNYWLDSTEVTQGFFLEVTGRSPVADTSRYGCGKEYPVYNVTWFDAVLFCNSRSKMEGLDTVYSYTHATISPEGSAIELTGIGYDFDRDGYRLPTESEWEFAARRGGATATGCGMHDSATFDDVAWYFRNSGNRTHEVARKMKNSYGLYDMAGNVFEWTNDWKGVYDGVSICNALGSARPNNEYEKVIKGGAYCYGAIFLRPSCRASAYETLLSTAADYIGFRCARGRIGKGNYLGSTFSGGDSANPVAITATGAQVGSFAGTSTCRVVFVNVRPAGRTLCFTDFGKPFPYVFEFRDDGKVYTPAISPDGRFVAYSSGNEGQSRPAVISVRSLDSIEQPPIKLTTDTAYVPRWWIDPASGDTCIVYVNSAVANDDPSWIFRKTFVQRFRNGRPVGAPVVLVADGGYHDGVSANGKFIVSSGNRLKMIDLTDKSVRQLFMYPENGKDAAGSTQVCNASMSPDTGTDPRCLFLDFGCSTQSSITGCSYGLHQYLFVATMSGIIKKAIPCPGDDYTWDNTEWSNNENLCIASVRNAASQAENIHLINIALQTSMPLFKGTELHQPMVWFGAIADPSLVGNDSIGAYNDPPVHLTQARFGYRMHFFWQLCDSIEYLFVGSSHTAYSIEPHSFTRHRVYNMAFSQGDPKTARVIVNNYALTHCKKLKFVGTDFIPGFFNTLQGGDFSFSKGIGASKGFIFDRSRAFWRGSLDKIRPELIARDAPVVGTIDSLNLERAGCSGWGGTNPGMYGSGGDWDTSFAEFRYNAKLWEEWIAQLDSLGITILFFITPENPAFCSMGYAGRYGPSLAAGKNIVAYFAELEKKYPRFHLYDANQFGNHDYSEAEACDPDHLCQTGARKFSSRIDSIMTEIMP